MSLPKGIRNGHLVVRGKERSSIRRRMGKGASLSQKKKRKEMRSRGGKVSSDA